jgi:hypothetical protein
MNRLRLRASLLVLVLIAAVPAQAQRTVTVGADSLVFSQPGSLVRVVDAEAPARTYLAYESAANVRMDARRLDSDGQWEPLDPVQYYCPTLAMTIGQAWPYLVDDAGQTRTAEVVAFENVSVPAGDFMAWRVDVVVDDRPGVVTHSLWFAGNVGMVQEAGFLDGTVVRRLALLDYSVSGPGFFPLLPGNTWSYIDISVDNRRLSVSALKRSFEGNRGQ